MDAKTDTLESDAMRAETDAVSSQTFSADRTAPRAATAWLRGLATGLSPSRLADAELCTDELVTNVVRYAANVGATQTVTVRVERVGSEVEITIEDEGPPFDPTATAPVSMPRTLDEALPGGRGLLLVRAIAPRFGYERAGDVNRVTIAFPLA